MVGVVRQEELWDRRTMVEEEHESERDDERGGKSVNIQGKKPSVNLLCCSIGGTSGLACPCNCDRC